MAVKTRKRFSLWGFLHFVARFLGLTGLVAAAVGAVAWFAFGYEFAGQIVVGSAAAAIVLAILAEIRGLWQVVISPRGAAGLNVLLQVGLATALVVGGNVFSFNHFKRYDCTRAHTV